MKIKSKSKKINKAWLNDHINDTYVKLAKIDGYRARAAYKLKEIDEAMGLIRPGQVVVDLGSAPGAWSQYLRRRFAPKAAGVGGAAVGELLGTIIALDILPMEPIEGVQFIQGDFREDSVLAQVEAALGGRAVDLVVSDMAPNITGIAAADQARSLHLCELALDFSRKHLKLGGNFLVKTFQGSGFAEFQFAMRESFKAVASRKPDASRGRSTEMYLLGKGFADR